MKKLILILLTITLISGCAGMPDIFQGLFGPTGPQVQELPPDILVIQNLNLIPNPPINAGDQFTVSFEIKNQEETEEVESVVVQLFDHGLCDTNENYLTPGDWTPSDGIFSHIFTSFAPEQTEFVEWTFTAPNNEQIGHLRYTCPIRFKINYAFTSISQTDVDVISNTRLQQLQRAGETPTFTSTVNVGRGPVKIYFDFGAALPIRTSSEEGDCIGTPTDCEEFEWDGNTGNCNDQQDGCRDPGIPPSEPGTPGDSCVGDPTPCGDLDSGACSDHDECTWGSAFESILPVFIWIEDKGTGLLGDIQKYDDDPDNALHLYVPKEFEIKKCDKFDKIGPAPSPKEDFIIYVNNQEIPMIKRKSPQWRCSFTMPGETVVPVEKAFFLSVKLNYTYDITGEKSVEIKPTLGV